MSDNLEWNDNEVTHGQLNAVHRTSNEDFGDALVHELVKAESRSTGEDLDDKPR